MLSSDELQSFLALGTRNRPLVLRCGNTGLAQQQALHVRVLPAQLLIQLEITLGEVQGLEHGAGRKALMKRKGVCPAGGERDCWEPLRNKKEF